MAKKQFNAEAVKKQISDLELKIEKLTITKKQLELALLANEKKSQSSDTNQGQVANN